MASDSKERTALHEVVAAAGSLLDPEALAALAVGHVKAVTEADASELFWWDEAERVLTPLAYVDPYMEPPHPAMHPGQGLSGAIFADGEERVVDDYQRDLDRPLTYANRRAIAGVPLLVGGRARGVLTAVSYEPRVFGEAELAPMRLMAAQLAPALMNMRLLAQAQRRTAEARALADLMLRASAEDEPDAVFALIALYGCRLLGADFSGVALADPDGRASSWGGVYGTRSDAWRTLTYSPRTHVGRVVFPSEVPIVSRRDDPENTIGPQDFPFLDAEGAMTGLSVPLRMGGEPIGSLVFGWRFDHEIAPAHLDFASALASFAAVLADQARQEHRLTTLVECAPVVLGAIDSRGYITLCQGRGLRLLGLGEDIVGRNVADVFSDSPNVLRAIGREPGVPRTIELNYRGRTFETHITPRAGGGFLVGTDVTERRIAQNALHFQATHDELTGLPNRTLVAEKTAAAAASGPIAALVFDVRSFDDVNETVGYDAGDELLRLLGERLYAAFGEGVAVGRTGGDEFTIVAGADSLNDALAMAARVAEIAHEPILVGGQEVTVTGRTGLAISDPGVDGSTLLRRADTALQLGRRENIAQVVWDANMAADRLTTLQLTHDLRRAIPRGELSLVFQPVVDLVTRRPVRAEALLRWQHPQRGAVRPDEFIPLAERSGLMSLITPWVVEAALAQCRAWLDAGLEVPVAVNVSAIDLQGGELAELVQNGLARHDLEPRLLAVEVTETSLLGDAGAACSSLQAIADLGVTVSIDDFGTGWSSLAYLKHLPAGEIKLDRTFVGTMVADPRDAAIVRAAIGLGQALGVEIVAEGIEDEATAVALTGLQCTTGQGYLFARPMPAAELAASLTAAVD
jgi:diguanylate cyclase (GGDEF)-like protein